MKTLRLTLAWMGLLVASCQENDLGSGANTMVREYAKPASETWKAARATVDGAEFKFTGDKHDQLGGEILARRANGCEVRLEVKSLDEKRSRVSVRVEPGDRDLANLLHERIAEKAGLGAATLSLFGGNCLKATYMADLSSCLTSATRTLSALRITTTGEETHPAWALLDGRLKDSPPVRIRIDKIEPVKCRVTFIAGNETSDDNQALARRMKDEFEKNTPSE